MRSTQVGQHTSLTQCVLLLGILCVPRSVSNWTALVRGDCAAPACRPPGPPPPPRPPPPPPAPSSQTQLPQETQLLPLQAPSPHLPVFAPIQASPGPSYPPLIFSEIMLDPPLLPAPPLPSAPPRACAPSTLGYTCSQVQLTERMH